jgi:hypothetical protein
MNEREVTKTSEVSKVSHISEAESINTIGVVFP